MLRSAFRLLLASLSLTVCGIVSAQNLSPVPSAAAVASPPQLRKLAVPALQAKNIATTLSLRYRDIPGVRISPDTRNQQLVVMAPEKAHAQIAADVQTLVNQSRVQTVSSQSRGPLVYNLRNISPQAFERQLRVIAGDQVPVTTQESGTRSTFQLVGAPLQGTTVNVDRQQRKVVVSAPTSSLQGWQTLIATLDKRPAKRDEVAELARMENAELAPIQRAVRLLQQLRSPGDSPSLQSADSPFRNAVFQVPDPAPQGETPQPPAPAEEGEGGGGVIGDIDIRYVPELDQIIIRGSKRDVARVRDVIDQIKQNAEGTQPVIEVLSLQHADCNAVAGLLTQLYDDYLSARQGSVSITSLDAPNALLLIGREEAIKALKELIAKIDVPIATSDRLRVFRLRFASAIDAETTVRDFFKDQPGDDVLRPGVGIRVRVIADYRTNSLVVNASPRDMLEVTRMINQLDAETTPATTEIKIFQLKNSSADDLVPTLQAAITGDDADGGPVDANLTRPATSLSIVAVDSQGNQVVNSGVLQGAVITADANANAIVVRAPSISMPLIGELIRQLDKGPGVDSLVKVFTIRNGDANQLTTALQSLFGDDAATNGTQVGAGNLAGLPSSSASSESSLVPLRFTTDIRTNSIVASGSADDLDVVESLLIRLDSEGFAERVTEVIWLRNSEATEVATAITSYVQTRLQNQTNIQQYQQGLGPFDLPDRDIVAVADVATNSILLSVSPRIYKEVRGLIDQLDRRRPMVLIKVLMAEVSLDDTFEIGGEIGLQDSLVFNRGLAVGAIPGANAAGVPGFNFNNAGVTNVNGIARETLAASGVSTFGLGTTNPTVGYGGFVLNAASDSVSLLMRTLQDANRLQVLSRPQIMTLDNQPAEVNVGRLVARVTDVINNGVAGTQVVTADIRVGLILQVTPRVGPDGTIQMIVNVTRSDRDPANGTPVPTGAGGAVIIEDIVDTTAQTILRARSGQTVVIGGLIQKSRSNFSRRVPVLADIPLVGNMFKYDQEAETRTELLIVMTPVVVNGDQDIEYVKQVESGRMSWCLADVVEAHGNAGLNGGNGLWGPATAKTIYPDMTPTVEREEVISDRPTYEDRGHSQTEMNAPQVEAPEYTMEPSYTSESGATGAGEMILPQPHVSSEPAQALPVPASNGFSVPAVESLPEPAMSLPPAPAATIEALPPEPIIEALPSGLRPGSGAFNSRGNNRWQLPNLPAGELNLPAGFELKREGSQPDRQTIYQGQQVLPAAFSGDTHSSGAKNNEPVAWWQAASESSANVTTSRQVPQRLGSGSASSQRRVPSISPSLWIR